MPVSSTFTEMVSTTMRNVERKVIDNVTDHNGLLAVMKKRGNIRKEKGGYEIQRPISYAENSTFQRYSGYDPLNVGASDVITSVKYDWVQSAVHVTASGREIRMNNSEEAMINLVKARTKVAYATAANTMSVDIYGSASLTNQMGGLGHLITSDGTGTVGGIVAGTYTFWKNKFYEIPAGGGSAITYANLKLAMTAEWLLQTRGTDVPDLIVFSHDLYSILENGLQDNQRYANADMGSLGFQSLQYKSCPVIFDDNTNFSTTAEIGYFLNTQYLYLDQHTDAAWTEGEERVPVNQDAVVVPIYWMGQMVCTNRSLQGRIHDLA